MQVTNAKQLPFSEQVFDVKLTGLELATLKLLTSNISGDKDDTLRRVASELFKTNPFNWDKIDSFYSRIESVSYGNIPLGDFIKAIDKTDKMYLT